MVERSPHGVWGGAERKGGTPEGGKERCTRRLRLLLGGDHEIIRATFVERKKKQDRRRRSSPLARSMYDVVVVVVVARVPPACLPGCLAFSPRAVASVVERKTRLNTITPYIIVVIHLP